jgi:hypothetical protein
LNFLKLFKLVIKLSRSKRYYKFYRLVFVNYSSDLILFPPKWFENYTGLIFSISEMIFRKFILWCWNFCRNLCYNKFTESQLLYEYDFGSLEYLFNLVLFVLSEYLIEVFIPKYQEFFLIIELNFISILLMASWFNDDWKVKLTALFTILFKLISLLDYAFLQIILP